MIRNTSDLVILIIGFLVIFVLPGCVISGLWDKLG